MVDPQKISELNAKTTVHDTDIFPIVDIEAETDETKKITGANLKSQVLAELIDYIDKTHLSQDFGASSARLGNPIIVPISGEAFRVATAATSPFSALINGDPSATSVVYDGETNENNLKGLTSGASYWGRFILHNTTRGNSRKIVSFNEATNTIPTESSEDDWANNDVITLQSQTNTTVGYIDVDLSAEIGSNVVAVLLFASILDSSAAPQVNRGFFFHPYSAYDSGKRFWTFAALASEATTAQFWLPVISQKITVWFREMTNGYLILTVAGYMEYADT